MLLGPLRVAHIDLQEWVMPEFIRSGVIMLMGITVIAAGILVAFVA